MERGRPRKEETIPVGTTFGHLKVINSKPKYLHDGYQNRANYECLCTKCGETEAFFEIKKLRSGNITQCKNCRIPPYADALDEKSRRAFNSIKQRCEKALTKKHKRYIENTLTQPKIYRMFEHAVNTNQPCEYSGDPMPLNDMSIDRRDSNGGYTPENSVLARIHHNLAKRDLTPEQYVIECSKVHYYDLKKKYGSAIVDEIKEYVQQLISKHSLNAA